MDIKAVFFDIDGTLVPFGQRGLPDDVRDAVRTLRRNGVKVFIATGRHASWIDNLGDEVFDGYVTVNGGMCLLSDRKTVIYTHPIAHDDVERLIAAAPSLPLEFCVVPVDGDIFISGISDYVKKVYSLINVPQVPCRPLDSVGDKVVVQLMAFGPREAWSDASLYGRVLRHCVATSWTPYFTDIIPVGSDKGVGISKMLEHFGLGTEEAMAFGDGDNDVAMLRRAGIGVAMGNASAEVKASADYVTTAADAGGVVAALRHFGLV